MPRRIPDKNTDPVGYRRYWRDRRVLDELKTHAGQLRAVADDSIATRREAYELAAASVELAVKAFEAGFTS